MNKKILSTLLIIVLIVALTLSLIGCAPSYNKEPSVHTVGNGTDLRFGVISDTQLTSYKDKYYYNYVTALKTLKDKEVQAIVFAGDLTEVNTKKGAAIAKEAWVEVFGSLDAGPIKNYIMGNHDFWLPNFFDVWEIPSRGSMEARFTDATGEVPSTHKIINGYHFINSSPASGDMSKGYDKQIKWIKKQLDIAVDDNDKPIFLTTHLSPSDTVYGSIDEGSSTLAELLKDYPQVVSLGGHTHSPLLDETSIWQGEYTAIQTQSLSYTGFPESDIENKHTNSNQPIAMIVNLSGDKMNIDRISTNTGTTLGKPWSLSLPIASNLIKYSYGDRKTAATEPTMSNTSPITTYYNGRYYMSFAPATASPNANIRYYKVKIMDEDTLAPIEWMVGESKKDHLLYVSDFDQYPASRSVVLEINRSIPPGTYRIEVTAIDCFGNESKPLLAFSTFDPK